MFIGVPVGVNVIVRVIVGVGDTVYVGVAREGVEVGVRVLVNCGVMVLSGVRIGPITGVGVVDGVCVIVKSTVGMMEVNFGLTVLVGVGVGLC